MSNDVFYAANVSDVMTYGMIKTYISLLADNCRRVTAGMQFSQRPNFRFFATQGNILHRWRWDSISSQSAVRLPIIPFDAETAVRSFCSWSSRSLNW